MLWSCYRRGARFIRRGVGVEDLDDDAEPHRAVLGPKDGAGRATADHRLEAIAARDERPDEGQGGPGTATLAGLKVAKEQGMQAPSPESQP